MAQRLRYRFVIRKSNTLQTMPMSRLAEYMATLAALFGQESKVHFIGLETDSTALIQEVEPDAQDWTRKRLRAVREDKGAEDAMRAYRKLNRELASDQASAALYNGSDCAAESESVLDFPGAPEESEHELSPISDEGSLQGIVIRVGGPRDSVPVHLKDGDEVLICRASRATAKHLARHLFGGTVRVRGTGQWSRDSHGRWNMEEFQIETFVALDDAPLGHVLADLREVARSAPFPENALEILQELRHGD